MSDIRERLLWSGAATIWVCSGLVFVIRGALAYGLLGICMGAFGYVVAWWDVR